MPFDSTKDSILNYGKVETDTGAETARRNVMAANFYSVARAVWNMHDALLVEQRRTNQLLAVLIELQGGTVPPPLPVPAVSISEKVAAPLALLRWDACCKHLRHAASARDHRTVGCREDGYFFVRLDDTGEVIRYWRAALRPLLDETEAQANEAPNTGPTPVEP